MGKVGFSVAVSCDQRGGGWSSKSQGKNLSWTGSHTCKGPEAGARLARLQLAANGVPLCFCSSGRPLEESGGGRAGGWLDPVSVDQGVLQRDALSW